MITAQFYMIEKIERLADKTGISIEARRPLEQHDNESLFALMRELLEIDHKQADGCPACCGTGLPIGDKPCACNGSGKITDAYNYLCKLNFELEQAMKERELEWVGITTEEMNKNRKLDEQITTLTESRDEWKRQWKLMEAAETKAEEEIGLLQTETRRLYAKTVKQAEVIERLLEALQESVLKPQAIQQMMREHDIVIDNHDDKMQKFAFTLYTALVNLATIAQDALKQEEVTE